MRFQWASNGLPKIKEPGDGDHNAFRAIGTRFPHMVKAKVMAGNCATR